MDQGFCACSGRHGLAQRYDFYIELLYVVERIEMERLSRGGCARKIYETIMCFFLLLFGSLYDSYIELFDFVERIRSPMGGRGMAGEPEV